MIIMQEMQKWIGQNVAPWLVHGCLPLVLRMEPRDGDMGSQVGGQPWDRMGWGLHHGIVVVRK